MTRTARELVASPPARESARRRHSRSDGTRARILETAERLFAERGIQVVSLREIAAAAGQSNTSAVQYHFGSKARLIHELLSHRVTQMEGPRLRMLTQANERGLLSDARTLLEIVCLPQLDVKGENGGNHYCFFLAQYLGHYQLAGHPHPVDDQGEVVATIRRVRELLRNCVIHLPHAIAEYRIVLSNMMFLNMVIRYRRSSPSARKAVDFSALLNDTFGCMIAALGSPACTTGTPTFAVGRDQGSRR